MNWNIALEVFGYIGTALVIISMMMSSVTWLRIFNISGSVISTIYSIICNTWPIAVMNIVLIIINATHLVTDALKGHSGGPLREELDACEKLKQQSIAPFSK